MLQRDRHLRTQIHQLTDACMFAAGFWIAYLVRSSQAGSSLFGLNAVGLETFTHVTWLYFALVPAAPLVLESQGFYNRPMLGSRSAMFWPLLKGCFILTIGLVLLVFLFKQSGDAPRGVMVFFGVISFGLVWGKEELLRLALQ